MESNNCLNIYNVERWGEGYFSVDAEGHVCVHPDADQRSVRLSEVWDACEQEGLRHPILLRFGGILRHRVNLLSKAFADAIQENNYQGSYLPVYPIKANQQRRVVSELIKVRDEGLPVGLEAGSKPELMVVLALSRKGSTIVCNGYKDQEYIRLALMGEKLGFRVFLVVEKLSELSIILDEANKLDVTPHIGLRVRLMSISKGNWQNTGGEKSKFGLSVEQLLEAVEICRAANRLDSVQMLHVHLGSQVANLRDIRHGMQETVRYFHELRNLDVPINTIDVGGGLGVDYEGTHSRSACSMNYRIEDYAYQLITLVKQTCEEYDLPMPDLISESGRALSAHHAVLLAKVIDQEVKQHHDIQPPTDQELLYLWELYQSVTGGKIHLIEAYQELVLEWQLVNEFFLTGEIGLTQRAQAETIYHNTLLAIRERLDGTRKHQRELVDTLNEKLADKLFVNFSIFQSLPDVWGIDQIFPILPVSGLDQPVGVRAVLQDITCDSDGRINMYVDGDGVETTLPLPKDHQGRLAVFMVGAYQEILGDLHNLFGDTDAVDIELDEAGNIGLHHAIWGDTVSDVLKYVNFDPQKLLLSLEQRCNEVSLDEAERQVFLSELKDGLEGYTYLE